MNKMLIANPSSMPERCKSFLHVGQASASPGRHRINLTAKMAEKIPRAIRELQILRFEILPMSFIVY